MLCTIYANRLEELKKVYRKFAVKANAIGLDTALTISNTYAKEVNVFAYDEIKHETYKKDKIYVDVVDIDINYPMYKLGKYDVVAVLDHTFSKDENMVYKCNDNIALPAKYRKEHGICQHCNTNHKRSKTVILLDDNGNYKQVGTTCLKEYTGINDIDLVKSFIALDSFFEESDIEKAPYSGKLLYHNTLDYLASCIHIIHKEGYSKAVKVDALRSEVIVETNPTDKETAQTVIDYFVNNSFDDDFLHNIHMALINRYSKESGFVAYAYIAYQKELEKAAKKANNAANSAYYGNIGDKIKVDVTGKVIHSYAGSYGSIYNVVITYIYRFTDNANHVFIWKSQKEIPLDDNGIYSGTITGTIKEYSDYNGTKQTVLTRCKLS